MLTISILCSGLSMLVVGRMTTQPIETLSGQLQKMQQEGLAPSKTNITEIDELVELFAQRPPPDEETLPPDLFNEFIERTKTLTAAERQIFEHYMNGLTPKEVTETMFISINTLKTHNRHIYEKAEHLVAERTVSLCGTAPQKRKNI